ncbi:MAG: GNAT family N-acetyltransferase, partial [Gaiellaceae bacterium]
MNVRPYADEDAAALAGLVAADEEELYGRPSRLQPSDVAMWNTYADELRLYEEDGRLAAASAYGVHGDIAILIGIVADKGRGLGTEIVEGGEAFARGRGVSRIHAQAREPDEAARRLFESRGYREVRRFYEMAIELDGAPDVPDVPEGLVLEPCGEDEYRAFYDALNEAFQDHWEWHPEPFEKWIERRGGQHRDEQGPLWWVIRDGEEIAAVVRNEADREGGGYVGALGVRRPWRGRGLAKILLLHTFADFLRRGKPRVSLGVDAD